MPQLALPLTFLLVKMFIDYIEDPIAQPERGLLIFLCVILLSLFTISFSKWSSLRSSMLGISMRKALVSLLYRKVLRLSHSSLGQTTSGKLISLSSGDMDTVQNSSTALTNGMAGPLISVLVIAILYNMVNSC